MTWSHYAAPCVPAFHGGNGGSTALGVTATTITVSARISNSGESAAVEASAQGAFPTQQEYLHDLQTYITYFNSQFQLYGRHVVLKVFQGQGDWLQEYQGQDLGGAQADAATAHDMGAFADATTGIDATTPVYAADLADTHVISIGGVVASQSFLEQYAPYIWTALGTVTDVADFDGAMICQRMAGLPAAFAGDAATRMQKRVFGIINPENPDYSQAGDMIQNDIRGCGGTVGKRVNYALDISTLETQDVSAVAQMKAAGVTTVVCLCDNVSPIFLTHAADQQQYHPEWISLNAGDQYEQLRAQDQWAHALSPGGKTLDPRTTEAYHVYKLADPNGEPAELTRLSLAYGVAMQLFNGLQVAGPHLTPATFEQAEFSLPSSQPGGDLGPWTYGRNAFSPLAATRIGWYNPNTQSPLDNKPGSWQSCGGADGGYHPIRTYDPAAYGRAHTQLNCFGQ